MKPEGEHMEYEIEELIPIVASLSEKYTSKESSSVRFETARMLMEAVIYCINECSMSNRNEIMYTAKKPDAKSLYNKGYEILVEKVMEAKKTYERLIDDFEDYGCHNYKDTIMKGMPAFFIRYDADFNPQNHILTLDYPTLIESPDLCGINLILHYLKNIENETIFLDLFERKHVICLLQKIQPEYQSLYYDNICYPVLLNAIGCLIADKPVPKLIIDGKDCKDIEFYFKGDDMEKIELKVRNLIHILTDKMSNSEVQRYLEQVANDYAVRIWNGLQIGYLERVFI